MSEHNKNKEFLNNKLSEVSILLEKEALDSALKYLLELLKDFPEEPEIYKNLGWIAFRREQLDEAEIYFIKALSLDLNNPDYNYNLGWVYFYNNKLDLSEKYYHKSIELMPENLLSYINIGAINYEQKDFHKALKYYLIAKTLDPVNTHLLNNLGDTYQKLEDYDNAIKTYNRVIKINPDNTRAYGNMANCYSTLGNVSIAEELCRIALSLNPQSVSGHYNLASLLFEQKLYNEALEEINQARSLSKHLNKNIFQLTIDIKKELNLDYEEELYIIGKLENEDPLYYYINEKNHYKVLDILLERLENDNNNFFYLSQLGYTLSQLGRYSKAVEIFEYALRINQEEAWTNQHYAFALSQCNRKKEAIAFYIKAIELNPSVIWPRKELAKNLIDINKHNEALLVIDEILTFTDESPDKCIQSELFSLKARILSKNDPDEAIDWYMLAVFYNPEESYNYEKISQLLVTKHPDTYKPLKTKNGCLMLSDEESAGVFCQKALYFYRSGNCRDAIEYYKKAIELNINYYPAYAGLSQALYEKQYTSVNIHAGVSCNFSHLVKNWNVLNDQEHFIISFSLKPFKQFTEKIIDSEGSIEFISLETKLTATDTYKYLQNEKYLDGTPYQGIRALGGLNTCIGIERVRDLLWKVPNWLKQVPATVAHEYAHQVYEVLENSLIEEIDKFYQKTINNSLTLVSEYSKTNSQEFFAENYSYFVRQLFHLNKVTIDSNILNFIANLSGFEANKEFLLEYKV